MNGGYCFFLEMQQTVACKCPGLSVEKCVKIFYGEPEKMFASIVQLKIPKDSKSSVPFLEKFIQEMNVFLNYVFALCHEMAHPGNINHLSLKIIKPRINQVYEVESIQASHGYAGIDSISRWKVWTSLTGRAIEDCPHRYHHRRRSLFLFGLTI